MCIFYVEVPLLLGISSPGKYDLASLEVSWARGLPEILVWLSLSFPLMPCIIQSCCKYLPMLSVSLYFLCPGHSPSQCLHYLGLSPCPLSPPPGYPSPINSPCSPKSDDFLM